MAYYLVNTRAGTRGEHEVHETTCGHLPDPQNRRDIGWHEDCKAAIRAAKLAGYPTADGCAYCCPDCHRK